MNIESGKAKYYGDTSEAIKDEKYVIESSTDKRSLNTYLKSYTTENNVKFTPREITKIIKVQNPEPKVAVNRGNVTNTTSSKFNLPEELALMFTAGTVNYSFPYGSGYGFDKNVHDIKVQPDGKILVAGDFEHYDYSGDTYFSPYLCRLNADGTFDDTFDTTNSGSQSGFNNTIYTIHLQSDGKIIIGGDFTFYDKDAGYPSNYIARLNSDGSYDQTYFIGNGFDGSVYKVEVQSDNKTVIGGNFTEYNGVGFNRIIRLLTNGSIDSTFSIGDGFNNGIAGYVNEIIKQPDGKLLIGGGFETYDGNSSNNIARLNTNGSYDTTFTIGNGFNAEVASIALQSDNKIIVGGFFDTFNNTFLFGGYIVRLDTNGNLDTTFGYGLDAPVLTITIQSDDKILVGGFFNTYFPDSIDLITVDELVRFHSDCTLDFSFYFETRLSDGVYAITILDDDMILIGGEFDTNGDETTYPLNHFGKINNKILEYPYVAKFLDCGVLTLGFFLENYEEYSYTVGSKTPIDYNKTYSLGNLSNPSQVFCGGMINVFPSVDVNFVTINEYDTCELASEDNSKLVLIEPYLGALPGFLAILVNKNYSVGDYLFYKKLFITDGDSVYFHGTFQITEEVPFNESNIFNMVEPYIPYETGEESIEANGQYIVTTDCVSGVDEVALTYQPSILNTITLVQPNGVSPCKELSFPPSYFSPFFGDLITYETILAGVPTLNSSLIFNYCDECLVSMADNGLLVDVFLNTGFDGGLVYTMVEQPDGKILVGGNFNQYLEVNVGNFMRINPDGSLDETFNLGIFNSYIRAIALQPDGKILVGGNFTNYDGYNAGRIIRLNSDGTIDSGFTYNSEFNDIVRAIAVQRDGKIVVGGGFNYYYDFNCPQIARLNSDGTPDPTFVMGDGFDGDNVYTINIESNIKTEFFHIDEPKSYTENIIVGGWFSWYNGTNVGGIVKLSPIGELLPDFGDGFNQDVGSRPRVNQIVQQPDGKLIIIGGGNESNSWLKDYNETWIPQNIVRLQKVNDRYEIDTTFTTVDWDYNGGFNGAVLSASVLPNGKIMVGGQFDEYYDNVNSHTNIPYLVRLNSDGTLDETFTFSLDDDYVNKILFLSSETLLVGGLFDSPFSKLLNLFIGGKYELRSFTTCDGSDSNLYVPISSEIITSGTTVYKGDFNLTPNVCGNIGNVITTPNTNGGGIGGSMYFDGNLNTMVQVDNSGGQFGFNGGNDFTIEWFQYYEGGSNSRPFSIGVYNNPSEMIGMSFEGTVYLWVNNGGIDTTITNSDLLNGWHHIAITRYYDGADRIWRVFLDGVQKTIITNNQDTSNTDTLTLGNQLNNDGRFQGYITNFRVNNQSALYTSDFTVPTLPLTCDSNVILTMDASNLTDLLYDSCELQLISSTGVTWSTETPFINLNQYTLHTLTDYTKYDDCNSCLSTIEYKATLYVRDGVNPDKIQYSFMKLTDIEKMLLLGPITTTRGPECYELINYYL